ncbi:MAG: hypothetical protein E5V22_06005 [Mesorhizobium sp.]|uniref:hypothetical protein n=1 Tax=Mesorhizobium sp. TaxID=1871066 RepID=UPI000FE65468|nr:hypothetical protein [Mesorhizobium sp.]RWE59802.1 MAG: hypothetical protein EOS24_15420 [Mesorhizobium sp.]TIX06074.1 MAG: hypothetical protein E5V57_07645 [Mesorhizobium sp.]TIY05783.1 MAG: hypothetical protein E5V22_06005 [Mesorhizobium sp.]
MTIQTYHFTDAELDEPAVTAKDIAMVALGFILGTGVLAVFLAAFMFGGAIGAMLFGFKL